MAFRNGFLASILGIPPSPSQLRGVCKNRLENSVGWNVQKMQVSTLNSARKFVREGCFNLIFGERGLKRAFQGGTPL